MQLPIFTFTLLSFVFAAEATTPQEQSSFKVLCSTSKLLQDELCTVKVYEDRWVMFDSEEAQVGVMIKAQCTPQMIESPPNTCLKMKCTASDAQTDPEVVPQKEEYILCFPPASDSEFQINSIESKEEVPENSENLPEISPTKGQENTLPHEENTNQPDTNGVIVIEDSSEVASQISLVEKQESPLSSEEVNAQPDANGVIVIEDSSELTSETSPVENQQSTLSSEEVNAQPDANGVIVIEDSSEITAEENIQINPANVVVIIEESVEDCNLVVDETTSNDWDEVIVVAPVDEVVEETVQVDEPVAEVSVSLIPEQVPEAPVPTVEENAKEEEVPMASEVKSVNIPRPKSPSRSPPASSVLAFAPISDDQEPIVIDVKSIKLADQKVAMDSGMKSSLAAQKEKISYLFNNPSVQQVKVSLYLNASEWSAIAEQI